jgi:CRP-like cAMP-binding protein
MSILSNSFNHLLANLSDQDAALLAPHLISTDLAARTVLYRVGDTIRWIYFPFTGIVSYVVGVSSGQYVEAGVIGRNSAVGAGALLDGEIAINEAIIQVATTTAMIDLGLLKPLTAGSTTLRTCFARHEEMALAQVQQVAACNALHTLEERLSRWLLQARDLLNDDNLPLTQDLLSQMLGVQRSSVTLAARRLQESGLINYHRGHIRLLDTEALQDTTCECYAAINAHFHRLVGWSPNGGGLRAQTD